MLLLPVLKAKGALSPKRNRKVQRHYDEHIYKERHLIECFFGKIKNFRRIFSRFDKTAEVFMGFLNFTHMVTLKFCSQSLGNFCAQRQIESLNLEAIRKVWLVEVIVLAIECHFYNFPLTITHKYERLLHSS